MSDQPSRPDGWISAMRADPIGTMEMNARALLRRTQAAMAGLPSRIRIPRDPASTRSGVGWYASLNPKQQAEVLGKQAQARDERVNRIMRDDPRKKAAFLKSSKESWQTFEAGRAQSRSPEGQAEYRAAGMAARVEAARQAAALANREREIRAQLAAPERKRR